MESSYQLKKPDHIKKRKRLGCGISSGKGVRCGKGQKGQLCRSGSKHRPWFEGGQMPLQRRVPKRGFNNYTKIEYQLVNLSQLQKIGVKEINPAVLKEKGVVASSLKRIKILGNGDIAKPMKITADAFTKSALEKIQKAGGETIVRDYPPKKDETRVDNG